MGGGQGDSGTWDWPSTSSPMMTDTTCTWASRSWARRSDPSPPSSIATCIADKAIRLFVLLLLKTQKAHQCWEEEIITAWFKYLSQCDVPSPVKQLALLFCSADIRVLTCTLPYNVCNIKWFREKK